MVSYLMQKDTDDDETMRNDGGGIINARDLYQPALLSALWSERESLFELEATEAPLQINNTALQEVVDRCLRVGKVPDGGEDWRPEGSGTEG